MKKLLLLSSAMLLSTSMAVVAGNGDHKKITVASHTVVSTKAAVIQNHIMKQNGNLMPGNAYTASTIPVKAADATSNVSYQLPAGFFTMGASIETGTIYGNGGILHGPAYQEILWKNTSKAGDSFSWKYYDMDGNEKTSNERDLITTFPFRFSPFPELTGKINGQEETYTAGAMMQTGGTLVISGVESTIGVKDGTYGSARFTLKAGDQSSFGDAFHSKEEGWDATIENYTVIYDAPASPYSLSSAWLQVLIDATAVDADKYTLNIKKVTTEGDKYLIGEILASGTCTFKDFIELATYSDGTKVGTLYFDLIEEEGGLVSNVNLTVDHPIAVELTGFKENQGGFTPAGIFSPTQNLDSKSLVGTASGKYFAAGEVEFKDQASNLLYCNDFVFSLGVTYSYLLSENNDYNFNASTTGESKTFAMNTFYTGDYWDIDGEGIDDWIQYSYSSFDPAVGKVDLTFTVSEMPTSIAGRHSDVTVSMPGASQKFIITQGNVTGIQTTEVSTVKAVCVGENIELTYSEEINSVSIINVAGQVLATYELSTSGKCTIPAVDLNKGMYLLKFNNNQTIKVIK